MPATMTPAGYAATMKDGTMTVHRVPIFVECVKGDQSYDAAWINAAVAKAQQSEREGYLPPLHIRHHEPATTVNDSVRAAGFFRIVGTGQITFKGSPRLAVFADLVITDPATQNDVLSKRLPYRSVEIFDVSKPAFDGLALLDHEAPFLELPMLMVSKVNAASNGPAGVGIASATFQWDPIDSVAAIFRSGNRANVLFREERMADESKGDVKSEGKKDSKADGGDSKPKDSGGAKLAAIVKEIESGEISVADFAAIKAAMQKIEAAVATTTEGKADDGKPAPAAAPGESMKNEPNEAMSVQFAAMQGKLEALEAKNAAFQADVKRKDDVADAMKRLAGRPLGADLEARLVAFHTKSGGGELFKAYVDAMANSVAPTQPDSGKGDTMTTDKVPEVAMKYMDRGTDAVDKAARFAREWEQQNAAGFIRVSLERYVELSMAKDKFAIVPRKTA